MAYYPPVSGTINSNVLSFHSIIVEPQKLRELYLANRMPANNLYNFFMMMGRRMAVKDFTFTAFEESWNWNYITVLNTVASPGQGAAITLTLAVLDHVNGRSFPRVGDTVRFPDSAGGMNGRIMTKVTTSATAHTITIAPFQLTDTIPQITAGTLLAITDNTFSDSAGQPTGIQTFPIERTFNTQILKETLSISGRSLVRPLWYNKYADDGKSIVGMYAKEVFETEMRAEYKAAHMFLFGQNITNTAIVTNAAEDLSYGGHGLNESITATKGIWNWAVENGLADTIALGSEAEADFQTWKDYLLSQGTSTDKFMWFMGSKRIGKYNSVIKNMTDAHYTSGIGGGTGANYITDSLKETNEHRKGLATLFDFASVHVGGIEFLLMESTEFSNPKIMNTTGYNYDRNAIGFPLGQIKSQNVKGGVNMGTTVGNVAFTYLDNNGYNRDYESWMTGAAGGDFLYNAQYDAKEMNIRRDVGCFAMHTNQFITVTE